jgi:hypothetical protein
MTTIVEIKDRVAGIPCLIGVTYWEPFRPGRVSGPPELCYPDEGGESEWDVLDRRGRPAAWLERKLTDAERERIDQAVFDYMSDRDRGNNP